MKYIESTVREAFFRGLQEGDNVLVVGKIVKSYDDKLRIEIERMNEDGQLPPDRIYDIDHVVIKAPKVFLRPGKKYFINGIACEILKHKERYIVVPVVDDLDPFYLDDNLLDFIDEAVEVVDSTAKENINSNSTIGMRDEEEPF
jgi:hypothetical protein